MDVDAIIQWCIEDNRHSELSVAIHIPAAAWSKEQISQALMALPRTKCSSQTSRQIRTKGGKGSPQSPEAPVYNKWEEELTALVGTARRDK